MLKELPIFYHPTEIVLVDDDVNYTKNIEMYMLDKEIFIRTFNNPRKAVPFINDQPSDFLDKIINIEDELLDKTTFNVNFQGIYQEIYNKKRFNTISIVIVDYAMPGLNGKEFLEQIIDSPVKKILLTGEADYPKAVEMFNDRLIDKFFRKSDEKLLEKLTVAIDELKIEFFQSITQHILSSAQHKSQLPYFDANFIKLVLDTKKQFDAVEYYTLDQNGSYLFLDRNGVPGWLIAKSEEDMQVLFEIAEGEKNVSKELLQDLKNKKKIAYFQETKDFTAPVNSWTLHEAKTLTGKNQTYYYTILKDNPSFNLNQDEILSYQEFLDKLT